MRGARLQRLRRRFGCKTSLRFWCLLVLAASLLLFGQLLAERHVHLLQLLLHLLLHEFLVCCCVHKVKVDCTRDMGTYSFVIHIALIKVVTFIRKLTLYMIILILHFNGLYSLRVDSLCSQDLSVL